MVEGSGIVRENTDVKDYEGKVVGKVTSGTFSPCLKLGVGIAYIDNKVAKLGNVCNVNVGGRYLRYV